jgi:hypothetical protein
VRDFHEHILKRRPTLSEFSHRPMALGGEAEDLFAHINP